MCYYLDYTKTHVVLHIRKKNKLLNKHTHTYLLFFIENKFSFIYALFDLAQNHILYVGIILYCGMC